jgi:hypothetical protein
VSSAAQSTIIGASTRNETKHAGRPPALSSHGLDEIIADILHGFQQRCPLTFPEIASIVQNKFQQFLPPDTIYHVLTWNPSLKPYHGQTIDKRRMTIPDEEIRGYFTTLFSTVSGTMHH